VTQATKEQAAGVEEIVKGVANAREQVRQITAGASEQTQKARNIEYSALQMNEMVMEMKSMFETQEKELENFGDATANVEISSGAFGDHAKRMTSALREISTHHESTRNLLENAIG